ncbi:Kynurenine formamidase [Parahypoxylon ruwenzoriense]
MAASPEYTVHQYGAHNLQRVGVWDLDIASKAKYWIIYIHGGAWRDPRVTHETFAPSISHIVRQSSNDESGSGSAIAAFASIDYRLSPHPDFPQDPASTPPEQYRGAKHPDHLNDVRAALAFLQRRYGFGSRYVLVGHSGGACIAFQLLLANQGDDGDQKIALPDAVFGFEGIYDLNALNARFGGTYAGFLTAAFGDPGPSGENWDAVAPAKLPGSYGDVRGLEVVAIAHSPDDELVDEPEMDCILERLRRDGVKEVLTIRDLRGKHDEIWQNGEGIARTVLKILRRLKGVPGS